MADHHTRAGAGRETKDPDALARRRVKEAPVPHLPNPGVFLLCTQAQGKSQVGVHGGADWRMGRASSGEHGHNAHRGLTIFKTRNRSRSGGVPGSPGLGARRQQQVLLGQGQGAHPARRAADRCPEPGRRAAKTEEPLSPRPPRGAPRDGPARANHAPQWAGRVVARTPPTL